MIEDQIEEYKSITFILISSLYLLIVGSIPSKMIISPKKLRSMAHIIFPKSTKICLCQYCQKHQRTAIKLPQIYSQASKCKTTNSFPAKFFLNFHHTFFHTFPQSFPIQYPKNLSFNHPPKYKQTTSILSILKSQRLNSKSEHQKYAYYQLAIQSNRGILFNHIFLHNHFSKDFFDDNLSPDFIRVDPRHPYYYKKKKSDGVILKRSSLVGKKNLRHFSAVGILRLQKVGLSNHINQYQSNFSQQNYLKTQIQ